MPGIRTRWGKVLLSGLLLVLTLFTFNLSSVLAAPAIVATIPYPGAAYTEGPEPYGNRHYITSITTNSLIVIDEATNAVIANISMNGYGNRPQGVGVNDVTNRVYVANFFSNTVTVIDSTNYTIIGNLVGPFNGPTSASVDPTTNRIYVTEYFGNRVSVVDGVTGNTITTVPVNPNPQNISVNPLTHKVYVVYVPGGPVTTIDGTSLIASNLGVNGNITFDLVNNRLYLTSYGQVTVVDGPTQAIVRTFNLASTIEGLSYSPATNHLYGLDITNSRVVIYNSTTLAQLAIVAVPATPVGAHLNPTTNRFYVTSVGANNVVSVIDDLAPPTISKKFGANTINLNGTTSLSFTITNPNQLYPLSGVSFLDNLPVGLVVANPPSVNNGCGGTLNAAAGASSISLVAGTVAANTNCTITLNVTGTSPGVKNNVTQPISANGSGVGLPSNTATLTVNPPSADVALQKSVDNPKPAVNANVTFTIKATNNGPNDATNLVVSDNLPAGMLNFVSYNPPSAGTVMVNGNNLSWNIGTLTNGSSATLQIVAQVCAPGAIINTITKSQSEVDLVSLNDSASIGLNAPTADIQVQKSVDNPRPIVSDTVSFTIKATNLGPDDATGVVVKDVLPAGLEYISVNAPAGTSYQATSGLWTIGALNNGQSLALVIQAKAIQSGTFVNTASKSAEDQYDFNPLNDSASVTLNVGSKTPPNETPPVKRQPHPADFVAQLRVTPDRLVSSETSNLISYTFTLKNIGEGRAGQVGLRFPLDANLELGYTEFVDQRVWVSAIVTDSTQPYIQIDLPPLEAKQLITGTIIFRPAASVSPTATLFTRYSVTWDDEERGGKQTGSNAVRFSLDGDGVNRDDSGGAIQFFEADTTTVSNGTGLKFRADFYAPNEYVTLWYTDKDGTSVPLGTKQADDKGKLELEFMPKDLVIGDTYVIAGIGSRSEVSGSLAFTVSS